MHAVVSSRLDALAEICRRFHVRRLEVFGSAARAEDFDPGRSDTDFLIEFESDVEESGNYLRRRQILREAEPIYVAR